MNLITIFFGSAISPEVEEKTSEIPSEGYFKDKLEFRGQLLEEIPLGCFGKKETKIIWYNHQPITRSIHFNSNSFMKYRKNDVGTSVMANLS